MAVGMAPQLVDMKPKRKLSDLQEKVDKPDQTVAAVVVTDSDDTDTKSSTQHQIQNSTSVSQSQGYVSVIKTVPRQFREDTTLGIHGDLDSDKIDIENLVDDCFTSEFQEKKKSESKSKSISSDTLLLPFKKRPRLEHFEYLSSLANITQDPVPRLTVEEEFRLHDLLARRDKLSEIHFKHIMTVKPLTGNACIDINKDDGKITYTKEFLDLMLGSGAAVEVGCLLKAEDNVDIICDKNLIYRCALNSFHAICAVSMTLINAAEEWKLRQQKAPYGKTGNAWLSLWEQNSQVNEAGKSEPSHQEEYSSDWRPKRLTLFKSPWARSLEDEEFYEKTIELIRQHVDGDLKLTQLFYTIIFFTPPEGASIADAAQLREIQADLTRLLYRYLASRMERAEAAEQAHSLMGIMDKLFRCGDILKQRRK